jgi:hypothetical protein
VWRITLWQLRYAFVAYISTFPTFHLPLHTFDLISWRYGIGCWVLISSFFPTLILLFEIWHLGHHHYALTNSLYALAAARHYILCINQGCTPMTTRLGVFNGLLRGHYLA